jgi:putative membrane protein
MTSTQLLTSTWHWYPTVLLGCAMLLGGYLIAARSHLSARAWLFATGVVLLLLVLVSPLDELSDSYLFSAHMLQHLLLMLVVPPLLLLGLPRALAQRALDVPWVARLERFLGAPVLAWCLGLGTEAAWHLPLLYNAALANEAVHAFQHLCFLVAGTIFWWPLLTPLSERRLAPLWAVVYLFGASVVNTILGIVLIFAPLDLYPTYLEPADSLGVLSLVRDQWGLSVKLDRQIGGLLMWVGGSLVFLPSIVGALLRWYRLPEGDLQEVRNLGA